MIKKNLVCFLCLAVYYNCNNLFQNCSDNNTRAFKQSASGHRTFASIKPCPTLKKKQRMQSVQLHTRKHSSCSSSHWGILERTGYVLISRCLCYNKHNIHQNISVVNLANLSSVNYVNLKKNWVVCITSYYSMYDEADICNNNLPCHFGISVLQF